MKTKLLALAAFVLGAATSAQVLAHHSFAAEFDGNAKIDLHGVVTKVDWTNPHTYIYIEVENEAGEIEEWGLEMGSPNGLMRRGWTRNTLEVGTEVIIQGTRARDGSLKGNAQTVILAETCQRMFAGTSQRDFVEDESAAVEGCTPSA
jgi:hypothetical protein